MSGSLPDSAMNGWGAMLNPLFLGDQHASPLGCPVASLRRPPRVGGLLLCVGDVPQWAKDLLLVTFWCGVLLGFTLVLAHELTHVILYVVGRFASSS